MPLLFHGSFLNKFEGRFVVWISGENREGKTLLGLDLAELYLRDGFRYISNLTSPWNDDMPLELDENGMLNTIAHLDEIGVHVRTKESIRRIIGFKGKANTFFILTGTEEPHEDLCFFQVEPHLAMNMIIKFLFTDWFYENIFKVWRWRIVPKDVTRPVRKGLFFQYNPKAFFRLYSTLNPFNSAEAVLSQFDKTLQDLHLTFSGQGDVIGLYDVATKRTGMGESQSMAKYEIAREEIRSQRRVPTFTKKGKK